MVEKMFRDVADVVGGYDGLARRVLDYSLLMKAKVDEAKRPGFTVDSWAPLADMIAVDVFERVGNFLEVMDWPTYAGFLTDWAKNSEWECSFKRITENDGVVWLELEERSKQGEVWGAINSTSVYEFDAAGKIRHLDIYLQMKLSEAAMPEFYRELS